MICLLKKEGGKGIRKEGEKRKERVEEKERKRKGRRKKEKMTGGRETDPKIREKEKE